MSDFKVTDDQYYMKNKKVIQAMCIGGLDELYNVVKSEWPHLSHKRIVQVSSHLFHRCLRKLGVGLKQRNRIMAAYNVKQEQSDVYRWDNYISDLMDGNDPTLE